VLGVLVPAIVNMNVTQSLILLFR